ncbi:hypothetical protein EBZ35_08070, partial [bacterium]|nr:hypothetical protein [bacterium]
GLNPGWGQSVYSTAFGASGGGQYAHPMVSNVVVLNGQDGTGTVPPGDRLANQRGVSPYDTYGNGGNTATAGSPGALRIRLVLSDDRRYTAWEAGDVSVNQLQVTNRRTVLNDVTVLQAITANVLTATNLTVDNQTDLSSLTAYSATIDLPLSVSTVQTQTMEISNGNAWSAASVTVNNEVTTTTLESTSKLNSTDLVATQLSANSLWKTKQLAGSSAVLNLANVTNNMGLQQAMMDTMQTMRATFNASTRVGDLIVNYGAGMMVSTVSSTRNAFLAQATVTGSFTANAATMAGITITRSVTLANQIAASLNTLVVDQSDAITIPTVTVSVALDAAQASINTLNTSGSGTLASLTVTDLKPATPNQLNEAVVSTISITKQFNVAQLTNQTATLNQLSVTTLNIDTLAVMPRVGVSSPLTVPWLSMDTGTVNRSMQVGKWGGMTINTPTLNATGDLTVTFGSVGSLTVQNNPSVNQLQVPSMDVISATSNALIVNTLRWNQANTAQVPTLQVTMPLASGLTMASTNYTTPG